MKYNGETKILAILGWPLNYSLSPRFQNEALRKLDINAVYVPLPVQAKDLKALWASLTKLPNFIGANITQPHKEAAMAFASRLSPEAKACASVNTLYRSKGQWIGHNTDLDGFRRSLPLKLKGLKVSLFGAGGAARSVVQACLKEGAKSLQIICRRPEQGKALLQALKLPKGFAQIRSLAEAPLAELIQESQFVVNSISDRAFAGELGKALRKAKKLRGGMDLAYAPPKNAFLKALRQRSLPAANGMGMLLEQGALSFEIWSGLKAPRKRMAKVLGH